MPRHRSNSTEPQEDVCQEVVPVDPCCEKEPPKKAVELSIAHSCRHAQPQQQPCPPPPAPAPCRPKTSPCSALPTQCAPITIDLRHNGSGDDKYGNLPRVKSLTTSCQTDPCRPPPTSCEGSVATACQTGHPKVYGPVCCREPPTPVCVQKKDVVRKSKQHKQHKHHKQHRKSHERTPTYNHLNFEQCGPTGNSFVHYFLKSEGAQPHVANLAETKLKYERKCRAKLAKFPKHIRMQAQEFFMKIIDAINTPTPDTQNTVIRHYHVMKYLHPVLAALNIDNSAMSENHTVHGYHKHILSVAKVMDERIKNKQHIDPACLVEVETQLLAGIIARFFPIIIKIKDLLVTLIKKGQPNQGFPPDEFIKQIRKLILCAYVEIACIDTSFTNTLTSMNDLPSVETQEAFRQELVVRKTHARHGTKWAARCLATPLLYYFMIDM